MTIGRWLQVILRTCSGSPGELLLALKFVCWEFLAHMLSRLS